jgi:hypothetical protein
VFGAGGLFARIQRRLSEETVMPWFREWAAIEQEAEALRWSEPLFVPGLLQTEAYARAVFRASGLQSDDEVERQIAARLNRQEILTRERPPLLTVVIDEFVLRRATGGPEVMREQLLHLAKLGTSLPRVRIHVVPASVGAHAGVDGPFVIATSPAGENIVYLECQRPGQVLDRAEDVNWMVEVWESIRGQALPQQQSTELILEIAETWT